MINLAAQFRDRASADYPQVLDRMFAVTSREGSNSPETAVGDAVRTWIFDESLEDINRDVMGSDVLALRQITRRHKNGWGPKTYFGPIASGEDTEGRVFAIPSRDDFSPTSLQSWRQRARHLKHPVAVARYADAAWDLARLSDEKPDSKDALLAFDSYTRVAAEELGTLIIQTAAGRALNLARQLRDSDRVLAATDLVMRLGSAGMSQNTPKHAFFAFDTLADAPNTTPTQVATLAQWLEEILQSACNTEDPFLAQGAAERLIAMFKAAGDQEAIRRVARKFGMTSENFAAKLGGLQAGFHLRLAHRVYENAGLLSERTRVQRMLQNSTSRSREELVSFSHSVEIPTDEIEALLNALITDDWLQSVARFVRYFLPTRKAFEEQVEIWSQNSVLMSLCATQVITVSGETIELPPLSEDRELHVIYRGGERLSYDGFFLKLATDALLTRHQVTPDRLLEQLCSSPAFPDDRMQLLQSAVSAYMRQDFAVFLHLAIPQIENTLRLVLRHGTDRATNSSRDGTWWRIVSLNHVIDDPGFTQFFGEDVSLYMRVLLCHELGWNLRNVICHGLAPSRWFGRMRADRVLHVLLFLSLSVSWATQAEPGQSPP